MWVVVTVAVVVAVVVPTGGFIYHFVFDGGGQQWLAVSVGGCGDCGWMWRFLSTVIFFFLFLLVVVVVWVVGFGWVVGRLVPAVL